MGKSDWIQSVFSDGSSTFVSPALPQKGEEVTIKIRMFEDAPLTDVILRTRINGGEIRLHMVREYASNGLVYYSTKLRTYERVLKYCFYIVTDEHVYYYNQLGVFDYMPDETYDFRIVYDYRQPAWVKNAVFYQIFPERFCNGNPDISVKDNEYMFDGYPTKCVKDWYEEPKEYEDAHCLDFYGGDLEGIRKKIPYLKELGVTALYLNPIFYAATTHKYDCLDYFHVDPHFGGDEALAKLTEELHANGMRIILDVSINHTGSAHKWFNRDADFFDKSVGAYNNPDAAERKYYFFGEGNTYKAWWGVETLPTLNYSSKELRDVLYLDEDSLVRKWLKPPYNTDGWRFDVADVMARSDEGQFHHEVWPALAASIKDAKNDAYIVAEEWGDCAEFLQGDEWDTPMNYTGCARPVREFVGENDLLLGRETSIRRTKPNQSAAVLSARIKEHLGKIPYALSQVQFNLLGSHDTPRLHNNPLIPWSSVKAAVVMLFTLPGTASIYYGDEVDIDGRIETNEGFRYPMPWKRVENMDESAQRAYSTYNTLANLKKNNSAFSSSFRVMSEEGKVFAFARFDMNELFFVICSMEDEDTKVIIPYDIFGVESVKGIEEAFGQEVLYEDVAGNLIIDVAAKESYVIKVLY